MPDSVVRERVAGIASLSVCGQCLAVLFTEIEWLELYPYRSVDNAWLCHSHREWLELYPYRSVDNAWLCCSQREWLELYFY